MSFDPFAAGSEGQPEHTPSPHPTGDPTLARGRVQAPGIALIVVGVLNLFLAVGPGIYGFVYSNMSPEQLEEVVRQQNPKALDDLKTQGYTIAQVRDWLVYGSFSMAAVDFLGSFLVILGGIRMLALKNYGLAILASILAAIPCISCSGCCGLGAIAGIWALVVLINPDVRSAFH
jgi:hypothetical protein